MSIDASGTAPVRIGFDQQSTAFLSNPDNYYWNVVAPAMSKANADLYAWKADGKFRFEDPVLRDFRFGARATYREARHFDGKVNNWTSIAEPWAVKQTSTPGQLPSASDPADWAPRGNFGYLSNPKYQLPTEIFNYGNFYRGKAGQLPNLVFPTFGLVKDYPNAYTTLARDFRYQQCLDGAALYGRAPDTCKLSDYEFTLPAYDDDPSKKSTHSERTLAAYGALRFGFEDWKFPVEGNVGARVVYTRDVSHGYEKFSPEYNSNTPPDLPRFDTVARPMDVSSSHVDVMPSLNLKVDLTKRLQGRLALSRSMNRPGFNQLGEYIELEQKYDATNNTVSYVGKNTGNVNLKPIKADSIDLALEWYPRDGQSLTGTVFHKDVKDIIMNTMYTRTYKSQAGNDQTFAITGPDNVARAKVSGFEIAGMTYLDRVSFLEDKLPAWSKGFGVSANYTYINGRQKLYKDFSNPYCDAGNAASNASLHAYGCDTNGVPFNDLPLPYMAKHALNFVLMYDKGPLSARLAYNWHSRVLQGTDVNGTRGTDATSADPARPGAQDVGWGLPTWQEAFGQWDGGLSYQLNDSLSMSFNVTNINDVVVRQTQQQHIGDMGRAWFYPGRSYSLTARYAF
jgi:TonB-dependent receptor